MIPESGTYSPEFVKLVKVVEAGQHLNEIGFNTSSSQTLHPTWTPEQIF